MKRILTKLIIFAALVCSAVSLRAATPVTAAGDYRFTQRNSDNSAWSDVIFGKQNGGIFITNGSGVPSILAAGTNGYFLSMVGGVPTWVAGGGGGGGVSSVGLSLPNIFTVSGSPVTSSGTLTGTLATQTANMVFAGPTTGSAATPAFRALVNADIPANSKPTATITTLKAVSVTGLTTGFPLRVTELDRVFTYSTTDTRLPNDVTIVRPDSISGANPGRWILVQTVNDFDKNSTVQGQGYLAHFHTKVAAGLAVKLIFSGDSTTEGGAGNGIVNSANNISTLVGTMLQSAYPAVTSVNAGHAGQSTALWLSTYLAADLAQSPDLYILRWGINDGSLNPDDFLTNLEAGLLIIRQSYSSAQMSILLMSPNSTNDNPLGRNIAWYERVVPALPILARKYQCTYIDTYSLYRDSPAAITAMDSPYAAIVNATSMVNGTRYQILSVGTTTFTSFGATQNIVGEIFIANGAGTGTGTVASTISAGSFTVGTDYTIATIGSTDFAAIGAAVVAVGQTFTATGAGSGTGKATVATHIHPHDVMNRWIGSKIYDLVSPSGMERGYALNNVTATRADASTPNVSNLPSTYPYGVSLARATPAGGWILDGSVYTFRSPDDVATQIVGEYQYNAFKVRTGSNALGWQEFQQFVNASGASLTAGTTPINYKSGFTTYNVLASNGWPTDGTVFSFVDVAGTVSQFFVDATGASQTRQSTSSSAWSSWSVAAGGTVTSVSVTTANGVSGTVATATTTPAITLSLGAITPTSITTSTATLGVTAMGNTTVTGFHTTSGLTTATGGIAIPAGSAPGSGTSGLYGYTASNTPDLVWVRSTSSSDEKIWDITQGASTLMIRAVNDAYNAAGTFMTFTRSGAAAASVTVTPNLIASGTLTLGTTTSSITGAAGDMTITAGTGNSRNLILRSTTSGGTATTFLTGNADQTTTLAGALNLLSGTSVTTATTGSIAFDSNAWATSFGAIQVNNGTASTFLVGVEATDTPTNGQVPTWNTGGTITWETPTGGASLTTTYVGYGVAGALGGEAAFTYTAASNLLTVGAVSLGAGGETSSIGALVDAVDGTTPLNNIIQTVAAGTAYTLTTSYAAVDFGTTDPVVTLTNAGTYSVYVTVQTSLVSATTTTQAVSFKLRRTNNTAADLPGSTFGNPLPVATIASELGPTVTIGPIKYTTANTNDAITVFGILSGALGAGTATATDCTITAIRAY